MAEGLGEKRLLDAMHYPIYLHCDALLAGVVIALAAVLWPRRFRAPERDGFSGLGFAIFLVAAVIGVALRMYNKTIFAFTALGLIYGGLTLWVLWDRSPLTAVAKWRIWYPVSRLSYGMYLNNFIVLPGVTFAAFAWTRAATGSMPVACVVGLLVGTGVSMSVALVSFVLVERPFLILRDRVLSHRVHMHAKATADSETGGDAGVSSADASLGAPPAPAPVATR